MSGGWSTQARVLVERAHKMIDEKRAPTSRERQFFESICRGAIDNNTDPRWIQCVRTRFMYYYREPDSDSDEEPPRQLLAVSPQACVRPSRESASTVIVDERACGGGFVVRNLSKLKTQEEKMSVVSDIMTKMATSTAPEGMSSAEAVREVKTLNMNEAIKKMATEKPEGYDESRNSQTAADQMQLGAMMKKVLMCTSLEDLSDEDAESLENAEALMTAGENDCTGLSQIWRQIKESYDSSPAAVSPPLSRKAALVARWQTFQRLVQQALRTDPATQANLDTVQHQGVSDQVLGKLRPVDRNGVPVDGPSSEDLQIVQLPNGQWMDLVQYKAKFPEEAKKLVPGAYIDEKGISKTPAFYNACLRDEIKVFLSKQPGRKPLFEMLLAAKCGGRGLCTVSSDAIKKVLDSLKAASDEGCTQQERRFRAVTFGYYSFEGALANDIMAQFVEYDPPAAAAASVLICVPRGRAAHVKGLIRDFADEEHNASFLHRYDHASRIMCRFAETMRIGAHVYHEDCTEVIDAFDELCKMGGKDGEVLQMLRKQINLGCLSKVGGPEGLGTQLGGDAPERIRYLAEAMSVAFEQFISEQLKSSPKSFDQDVVVPALPAGALKHVLGRPEHGGLLPMADTEDCLAQLSSPLPEAPLGWPVETLAAVAPADTTLDLVAIGDEMCTALHRSGEDKITDESAGGEKKAAVEKQLKLTKQYEGAYGWDKCLWNALGGLLGCTVDALDRIKGAPEEATEPMPAVTSAQSPHKWQVPREQTIMITPILIHMVYNGDVERLEAKLNRDIGFKRHAAATPEERLKWTVKPMHVVLSWPDEQGFVDQWGGELVDGKVTFEAMGKCLRRRFPGDEGDTMASCFYRMWHSLFAPSTIGLLAIHLGSKRVFSRWIGVVQQKPRGASQCKESREKYIFIDAFDTWLDLIRGGAHMYDWWLEFVNSEPSRLDWTGCHDNTSCCGYLLTDSNKTAWTRSTILRICVAGVHAQTQGAQEAEDRLSVAMLTVVANLSYGDVSWRRMAGTSRVSHADQVDQWFFLLGAIALDMMDLFTNCFGESKSKDAPFAASAWGMRWLLTTSCQKVNLPRVTWDKPDLNEHMGMRLLQDGEWLLPSIARAKRVLNEHMGMRLLQDGEWLLPSIDRAKRVLRPTNVARIASSNYSTRHLVDNDVRIFMTTVMDQSLRALTLNNVEVWGAIVGAGDPATSVLKAIVSSGRRYDRHMAAQWDFSLLEVEKPMKLQFWKVFAKLAVGRETLSPQYLDTLFDAAAERLAKRAKEEADAAAAVEGDLFKLMEAENEAEAKRKAERLASKDDRKEAEARRKASAEQRRLVREEERKEEQQDKEDSEFVGKWETFITNANKYAKKNWEDYRAAEGKDKDKMRKNLYHRLDEYNKLPDAQKKLLDHAYWLCSGEYGHATEVGTGPLDIFLRTYSDYRQTEREEKEAAKVSRRPPPLERLSELSTEPPSPVELSPSEKQQPVEKPLSRQQKKNKKKAEEEERLKELALAAQRAELERIANDTPPVNLGGRGGQVARGGRGGRGGRGHNAFRLYPVKTCNVNGGDSGHVFTSHPPPPPPPPPAPPPAPPAAPPAPPAMQECPDDLCCSITLEPMVDAACIPCGHTFSRGALLEHMGRQEKEGQRFACPECRAYFNKKGISTNYTVQKLAAKYA